MPKINLAFWNTQNNDLSDSISNIIHKHKINIFAFAELPNELETMRQLISSKIGAPVHWHNLLPLVEKTKLLSILNHEYVTPLSNEIQGRLSIFSIHYPLFPEFLAAIVHFPSRRNKDETDLEEFSRRTINKIHDMSREFKNERILVIGDFNQNPYEKGMLQATGFHAVMDEGTASRRARTCDGQSYPMLYSPMWSLMGDRSQGPPGTHYYSPSKIYTSHWHMLDQVLLSPGLLDEVVLESVEILSSDGVNSLLNENGLLRKEYSDHLPIKVEMRSKELP